MKPAYYKITEEKQKRIEAAAIKEFSNASFNEASLNNIIKTAGISKGGMFKYIEDKGELYLHVFDIVLNVFFDNQKKHIDQDESCFVNRTFDMVLKSRSFYEEYPAYFKLMIQGSIDYNSPCYEQLLFLRHELLIDQKPLLLDSIDWDQYNLSQDKVINYVTTLFLGINMKLLELLSGEDYYDLERYFDSIEEMKSVASHGLKGA